MTLQTWVARFVVDNGQVSEEGSRLRIFQRRHLDEPDADLYLLSEPTGPRGDEHVGQALEEIGAIFVADRQSLTGGLIRALRATNEKLVDWNQRSIAREQVGASIAALILCGDVAYVAQCGPMLSLFQRGDRGQRFAARDAAATPLGEAPLEPDLRRFDLAVGDLLLLASSSLSEIVDGETLDTLLERGAEAALPELYLRTRHLAGFALLAVTCFEAAVPEPEPDPVPVEEPPLSVLEQVEAAVATAAPAPTEAKGREAPPLDLSRAVVRLRGEQSAGRGEYTRTTGPPAGFRLDLLQARWIGLLGVIAFLALIAVFIVPGLIDESRDTQLVANIASSQEQLSAALIEEDPARKRELFEGARRDASEALRLSPDNPVAADLHERITAQIEALDAILPLGPMTTVTRLSQELTGEVSLDGLVVATGVAYLLDTRGGRIVSVPLSGSEPPSVIFEQGETYGGTPAEQPLFFAWEATAGASRLLVLDAERKLFEVRPGLLPAPLPLRQTNLWASVGGIATYDGNLYVLDPAASQVFRYLPAEVGFDSEPEPALVAGQELGEGLGILVAVDIYVFGQDGSIRRFRNGEDVGFSLGGIDRPIETPTAAALLEAAEEILIADSGNKRIVVADKDGVFRRQLVSNEFTDLRAIGVDPAGAGLFVVVGDTLLTAPLIR